MNAVNVTTKTFLSSLTTLLTAVLCVSCSKTPDTLSAGVLDRSNGIIGGEVVDSNDSSLNGVLKVNTDGCSSVQITESLVLTAAHCTEYSGLRSEGATFSSPEDKHNSIVSGEVFVYPTYTDLNSGNDLALTVISSSRKLDPKNNFALPETTDLPDEVYIAGYGMTDTDNSKSEKDQLRKLRISSSQQRIFEISSKTLGDSGDWGHEKFNALNKHLQSGGFYCFKPLSNDKDMPYSGDSGGPLFSVDKEGNKTIHGVFSIFVISPSISKYYFFCYESIYSKLPWIKKSVEQAVTGLKYGLEVKIGDQSLSLENKLVTGIDISKARQVTAEVISAGSGSWQDFSEKDLKGRVLLIKRGEFSFTAKMENALRANADIAGIIFYDNVDAELFSPHMEKGSLLDSKMAELDMRLISKKDGEHILNELNNGNKVEVLMTIPGSK